MSGEHELPTASVVRFVASAERPPPWTTLHWHHTRRVPLIKLDSVFKRVGQLFFHFTVPDPEGTAP